MAAREPQIFDAIPPEVVSLCERLREHGKRGWVVGGCVRDLLRGVPASDWDIATDARPGEVRRIFARVVPTGIKHGTVTVLLHGRPYEVTTLRGEGPYLDGRRPEHVEFIDDLEQDLARRDFTFNAIALDPLDRELIDPFEGRRDLEAHIVRAVGDPLERFREDGLRVLRAARFAATLECRIDDATLSAMGAPSSLDTFAMVSAERIHDEWLKTMRARQPSVAFEIMRKTDILARSCPELLETVGHPHSDAIDVWGHSLRTLDACAADPVLRVAALLHDIGKPRGGDAHPELGAETCDVLLRRLKFSNQDRERIVHVVRHHCVGGAASWSDTEVRRWIRRVGVDRIGDVVAIARAGAAHGGAASPALVDELEQRTQKLLAQGVALSARDLALDGGTLMRELGMKPSPRVGELLGQLLELVTEEPSKNERAALLEAARSLLLSGGGS
jgi:tRNA nucleotidyltransferase (CCA-adding enzyme)